MRRAELAIIQISYAGLASQLICRLGYRQCSPGIVRVTLKTGQGLLWLLEIYHDPAWNLLVKTRSTCLLSIHHGVVQGVPYLQKEPGTAPHSAALHWSLSAPGQAWDARGTPGIQCHSRLRPDLAVWSCHHWDPGQWGLGCLWQEKRESREGSGRKKHMEKLHWHKNEINMNENSTIDHKEHWFFRAASWDKKPLQSKHLLPIK